MRKVVSLFLLVIILVSTVGYFPVFKLEQWKIRTSMKHKIEAKIPLRLLHVIKFSDYEEIKWIREGKEFMIGDRMYDIVRTDPKNSLKFYCIDDIQETKLFSNLSEKVNLQTQDPNLPLNKSAKSILDQNYLNEPTVFISFTKPYPVLGEKMTIPYINNYCSVTLLSDSPPPVR